MAHSSCHIQSSSYWVPACDIWRQYAQRGKLWWQDSHCRPKDFSLWYLPCIWFACSSWCPLSALMSSLILIAFWHGQGTVQLLLCLPGPSLVLVPKPYQSHPCRLHQLWSWSSPSVLIYWFFTLQVPKVLLTVACLWSLNVKPWCHTYLSLMFLRTSGGKLWKHWKPRSTVLHLSISLFWETRHESYKLCLCIHICCHSCMQIY